MILPNGSPRIIAIEVPVTTILSASERNFSDTTLTAAGDAIDQNTECVHATPIRDTINIPYEAEKADSSAADAGFFHSGVPVCVRDDPVPCHAFW